MENGHIAFQHGNGYLDRASAMDAEEFFQAREDARLGRWRYPLDPEYVVYAYGRDAINVMSERNGSSATHRREDVESRLGSPMVSDSETVARAYFEAHPEQKLPEENGVYVPASADLASGPLTFVLYGGSWRATPGSDDAAELAQEWHTRVGLVRLGKTEVAS